MRVLFLSSCVRGGGPGWSLYYLLKHLDPRVIRPTVLVPCAGIFANLFDALEVEYFEDPLLPERLYTLRFKDKGKGAYVASTLLNVVDAFKAFFSLIGFIKRSRGRFQTCPYDLIYCNNMLVEPIGAFAGLFTGTPVVIHARNIHRSFARRRLFTQIAHLPAVKRVICISSAVQRAYAPSGKTVVVPNGVDLDEYNPQAVQGEIRGALNLSPGVAIVGYVGRMVGWKGVDVLLKAACQVLSHRGDVAFCLVGGNPLGSTKDFVTQYRERARSYGIEGHVHFSGFKKDVRPYLKDFDLLAVPSKDPEPFGRVNIEAMAMGVPVIATAHGGPVEIIEDGIDGLLVRPNDPDDLARGILELCGDRSQRERMSERAREKARRCFDASLTARRVERIILEAL